MAWSSSVPHGQYEVMSCSVKWPTMGIPLEIFVEFHYLWPENSSLDLPKIVTKEFVPKFQKRHLPKTALKPIPSTQFLRTKKALLCKIERQLRLIHLTWVFGNKFFLFRTFKSYKRQTPAPQLVSAHLGFTISRWQVTGILSDFGPVFWIQPHPWVVKFSQKQPSCFFPIRFLVLRG